MDRAALVQLASDVASTDFAVARSAATQLRARLTPDTLAAIVDDKEQAAMLGELLHTALDADDEAVTGVLGSILCDAIAATTSDSDATTTPSLPSPSPSLPLLQRPHAWPIIDYVLRLCSRDELASRGHAQVLLIAVLRGTEGSPHANAVGVALEQHFCNSKLPRLFDCDDATSSHNALVCRFLCHHAPCLLDYVFSATTAAFDVDDVLLLINHLVVCGIVGRHTRTPDALTRRVEAVIAAYTRQREHDDMDKGGNSRSGGGDDEKASTVEADATLFAFVCRYCSIVLHSHADNARRYADPWVSALLRWLTWLSDAAAPATLRRHADALDAVCDVVAAAGSTRAGWLVLRAHMNGQALQALLHSRGLDAIPLSLLRLLAALLSSTVADADDLSALYTAALVRDVWQLHRHHEEAVQLAVWDVVAALVRVPALRAPVVPLCASYLAAQASNHAATAAVRRVQLRVASTLLSLTELPRSMQPSLECFVRRGLYPAGSSGVAAMRRD